MVRRRLLAAVLCFVCIQEISFSAPPSGPLLHPEQFKRFHRLTVDDGLSQNLVIFMHQDRKGFMWFGTAGGLDRFDGVEFKHYRAIKGIPRQPVYFYSCLELDDSTFWLGTDAGLLRFNPVLNEGTAYHPAGLVSHISTLVLSHITEVKPGILLFGMSERGIMRFNSRTKVFEDVFPARSWRPERIQGEIVGIASTGDGKAIILSERHLMEYDDRTQSVSVIATLPRDCLANCMWVDRVTNEVWAGTTKGLFKFSDNAFGFVPLPAGNDMAITNPEVESILGDKRGTIWIGMSEGVAGFTPSHNEVLFYRNHPSDPSSVPSGSVLALCTDRTENLWMSIHDRGVAHIDLKTHKFRIIGNRPGLPVQLADGTVTGIAVLQDGSAWISAGGLHHVDFNRNSITRVLLSGPPMPAHSAMRVMRIRRVTDSLLCLVVAGRAYLFESANNTLRPFQIDGVTHADVRQVFIRPSSGMAVFFLPDSIIEVDVQHHHRISTFVKFGTLVPPTTVCTSIVEDPRGTIWFGTNRGLYFYDSRLRLFQHYTNLSQGDNVPPNQPVLSLSLAANGVLWIGTDAGVRRIEIATGATRSFTAADGLTNDKIWCTMADRTNTVWLGTNRGLIRLRENPDTTFSLRTYTTADGLPSNEFNMSVTAMDSKGTIYFGTSSGVVSWSPQEMTDNPHSPSLVLTNAMLNGLPVAFGQDAAFLNVITIPYDKKVLSLSYAALNFTDPSRNRYAYHLEGYDRSWNDAGARREAIYTNLDPGEYVFRVKASNNDGVWSDDGLAVKLVIVPPFWMTWWFRIAVALAALGAVGGAIRYWEMRRIKDRVARLEQERALERERTRISRDMHDELGANLTSLAMITEIARRSLDQKEEAEHQLQRMTGIASETIQKLDEIVWAVNPRADNLGHLVAYISEYAQEFFDATPVRIRFDVPANIPEIPLVSDVRHNIFLAVKEALTNIVKHSAATEASITVVLDGEGFSIEVKDNGKGCCVALGPQLGNGVGNMRQRIESIGGAMVFTSSPGGGTSVLIRMQLNPGER